MAHTRRDRNGFSLVELMVAMTIIGLLAYVMWARVDGANREAYRSSVMSELRSVAVAQELYYQDHLEYGELDDLEAFLPTEGVTVTMTHADGLGFAVTGSHVGLGGVTCGYYAGTVPAGSADPAEEPRRPVCD